MALVCRSAVRASSGCELLRRRRRNDRRHRPQRRRQDHLVQPDLRRDAPHRGQRHPERQGDHGPRPIHRRAKAGLGRTFQTSNLFPRLSVLENVRLAAQAKLGGSFSVLRFPSDPRRSHPDRTGAPSRRSASPVNSRRLRGTCRMARSARWRSPCCWRRIPPSYCSTNRWPGWRRGTSRPSLPSSAVLHRDRGCTVLMVEHHMDVVLGLVDRVAVMHHGSLLALDSPGRRDGRIPPCKAPTSGEPV